MIDLNATFTAIQDPDEPDDPDGPAPTWLVVGERGEALVGGLNPQEARRIAACLNLGRGRPTELVEAQVRKAAARRPPSNPAAPTKAKARHPRYKLAYDAVDHSPMIVTADYAIAIFLDPGAQENARRALACLQACAGISTAALQQGVLEKLLHAAAKASGAVPATDPERTQALRDVSGWLSVLNPVD